MQQVGLFPLTCQKCGGMKTQLLRPKGSGVESQGPQAQPHTEVRNEETSE